MTSETMELTLEQQEMFEREVTPIVQRAHDLVITTPPQSFNAQELVKEIKRKRSMLNEKLDPAVKAAYAAHQAAKKVYNWFVSPFDDAETIIKRKIVTYESEQERKRQEEARLAEAKRQEAERLRREELERQARAAEEKGRLEKAEALREKAETVVAPPVFTPPPPPKAAGTVFKKTWRGEVVDIVLLCKAIGEGKASSNMVLVNQTAINGHAKANKDGWPIPGVIFREET